jgi:hypothetical protein
MEKQEYIKLLSSRLAHIQNLQSSFTGVFITLLTALLGIAYKNVKDETSMIFIALLSDTPYAEGIYALCMIILFWAFLFALYQAFASIQIIRYLRILDPVIPEVPWYFNGTKSRIWLYGITHSFPAILSAIIPLIIAYYCPEKRIVTVICEFMGIPSSFILFYYAFRDKKQYPLEDSSDE